MERALLETEVPGYKCRRGKVEDIYYLGNGTMVIIATDRIPVSGVIMKNGIPGKGIVLTALTKFWLKQLGKTAFPNHTMGGTEFSDFPEAFRQPEFEGRIMLCEKAKPLPVKCVMRGYLAGSGWKDYQETGMVCGIKLPRGLRQCQKLPEFLFTPAAKAEIGHDENISFEAVCELVGKDRAEELMAWSLALYAKAHDFAKERGLIIADTEFKFGVLRNRLILIGELLTPDSSRFWPADQYKPGRGQASFDKQYVRDYLQKLCDQGNWDKNPPGPELPDEIVEGTRQRYLELHRLLTGEELAI